MPWRLPKSPSQNIPMDIHARIAVFHSLTREERKCPDRHRAMASWLKTFIEDTPAVPVGYQMLFLFSFYYGHDTEWSLIIARDYYSRTRDHLAAILIAVMEEEFRGGIGKKLYDLLTVIGGLSRDWEDICCFYRAMYLKKNELPYEDMLLKVVGINEVYPRAWLELARLHDADREKHNRYLNRALQQMSTVDYRDEHLFTIDYFLKEVAHLSTASHMQLEYFRAQLKK